MSVSVHEHVVRVVVVTRSQRDFAQVPDLDFEVWN